MGSKGLRPLVGESPREGNALSRFIRETLVLSWPAPRAGELLQVDAAAHIQDGAAGDGHALAIVLAKKLAPAL